MVAVAGSILGERGGEHLLLGQQAAEPQRTDAGEFDLHQNHIGIGDGRSVVAQPEIQLRIPPAQVGIKGDAQLRLIDPRKGQPVIGDEHPRLGAVALLEPPDFLPDLAEAAVRQLPRQKGRGLVGPHGDAALIHHAVILFLQLHEHPAVLARHAVAADAELFLIHRLLQRGADQPPVRRIIINVADGICAVGVLFHIGRHALQDRPLLLRRQAVLFFIAFKAGFDLCCHVEHLLYDAIIQALPKRNLKETL